MPYEQFVYEVNCKGENVLVKSLNSDTPVTVRFTNQTSRPVNVWWRNIEGRQVFYGRIEPGASLDQGTFLTHPWQFTDACTEQYYVINNKGIFRPPPELACQTANFNITEPSCCAHTCFSFFHEIMMLRNLSIPSIKRCVRFETKCSCSFVTKLGT